MFLKHLHNFTRTLSFKVSVWYSSVFILSSLLLFLITYYFISTTIKNQDHEEILLELNEISAIYEIDGINAIEKFVMENNNFNRTKPLFIRIADSNNKTLHIFFQNQWKIFNLLILETTIPDNTKKWIQISAYKGNYVLDVNSILSSTGHWVQVGMSSEGRENVLEQFRKIFMIIMIFLFILGLIGGIFLSYLTLQPIRKVIQAVKSIDIGKMTTKLPRSMTGDEVDELTGLFNEMLENINCLIINMKNSLDNVAHDLRTPMTRFRNVAEVALLENSKPKLLRNALETNIEESDHILKILETIMDISEAETGVMKLDCKAVNLSALIEKIIDMYQIVAEEKGVKIKSNLPGNIEIMIDPTRIGQVIANILDNAIKFTPSGGTIDIETIQINNEIKIIVKDTGMGIGEEELPKVWDRLYRGDQSRTNKGLGLGLSIARGIVKAHKGIITVTSELYQGSTFTISLPESQTSKL
ncbi:MAG: HAMP domain-containing histidine kinase [Proteobacteria bacterium]|nr:HAMP domain-containing histidine kinase [Desulfobacula sp.]MBU0973775.1 HAMP domain-containing histidine kinase [Pseudomonadota bacterium]